MTNAPGDETTILVVDDDDTVREFIKVALEGFGYRVMAAADGASGLAIYREHYLEIDLVLLDMMMPDLDGAALFRALRQWDPQVKCLMVSGYAEAAEVEALRAEGLLGLIKKPFTLTTLAKRVEEALVGELCNTHDM